MQIPLLMPQLGESIAEARILRIMVSNGQSVKQGEEIMEVETDKAVMSVTAPCDGALQKIDAEEGQSYPVGASLGLMEVREEDAQNAGLFSNNEIKPPPNEDPEPAGKRDEDVAQSHFAVNEEESYKSVPVVEPVVRGLPVPAQAAGAGWISPRLRARMDELGMNAADLAGVAGTGAAGRVTVVDFEKFIEGLDALRQTKASPMRIAVADSMRRSWTRPLATVGINLVLDPVLTHRRSCQPKPGMTLYAMRALAIALAENTAPAGRLIGNKIVHPKSVDIGFAVEAEDGVLVPVIRDLDGKKLSAVTADYNLLIDQARSRRIPRENLGNGIATVTNFGAFGIMWATPIPLPEQNLVLGIGAGAKKPYWSQQINQFIPMVTAELTLSFDHRVLDGGGAGRLLERVAQLLAEPDKL